MKRPCFSPVLKFEFLYKSIINLILCLICIGPLPSNVDFERSNDLQGFGLTFHGANVGADARNIGEH